MIKGVSETIQGEGKEQKGGFLGILLGLLVASLLGNLLTGERVKAKIPERVVIKAGEGAIATYQGQSKIRVGHNFFMPTHPLTNFEIQTYQVKPKFHGAYRGNDLPKVKDGAFVISLDKVLINRNSLNSFVC